MPFEGWGAAAVGAAVVSGAASSYSAKKAAGAQSDAAGAGIDEQRRQFDKITQLLSPYSSAATGTAASRKFDSAKYLAENPDVDAVVKTGIYNGQPAEDTWLNSEDPAYAHYQQYGQSEGRKASFIDTPETKGSLSAQQDLLGLNGNDAQAAAIDALQNSPQFSSMAKQGENSILQNASATGGLRGGNTQDALSKFRPQLLNSLIDQQYNRLAGLTQVGQASAAGQATAAQNTGTNVSNLLADQGAATAGRYLAQGQAVQNVGNSVTTAAILNGKF